MIKKYCIVHKEYFKSVWGNLSFDVYSPKYNTNLSTCKRCREKIDKNKDLLLDFFIKKLEDLVTPGDREYMPRLISNVEILKMLPNNDRKGFN